LDLRHYTTLTSKNTTSTVDASLQKFSIRRVPFFLTLAVAVSLHLVNKPSICPCRTLKATGTFHVIQACLALEKYAACL
jgi:hypothetical protein